MSAPDGFHYEWVPDDGCRVATPDERAERKCRRPRCGGTPVMALWRTRYVPGGYTGHWWLYCADHTYGRRINDGVVEFRILVNDSEAA